MKKLSSFIRFGTMTSGKENTKVRLLYLKVLDALFLSFSGGKPHVGAITATFKPNSKKYTKTLKLFGDHDEIVTRKSATILAQRLKGPIVAVAGHRYAKEEAQQLNSIVKNSERLSRRLVKILQMGESPK